MLNAFLGFQDYVIASSLFVPNYATGGDEVRINSLQFSFRKKTVQFILLHFKQIFSAF